MESIHTSLLKISFKNHTGSVKLKAEKCFRGRGADDSYDIYLIVFIYSVCTYIIEELDWRLQYWDDNGNSGSLLHMWTNPRIRNNTEPWSVFSLLLCLFSLYSVPFYPSCGTEWEREREEGDAGRAKSWSYSLCCINRFKRNGLHDKTATACCNLICPLHCKHSENKERRIKADTRGVLGWQKLESCLRGRKLCFLWFIGAVLAVANGACSQALSDTGKYLFPIETTLSFSWLTCRTWPPASD